jgi:hypothetical protein
VNERTIILFDLKLIKYGGNAITNQRVRNPKEMFEVSRFRLKTKARPPWQHQSTPPHEVLLQLKKIKRTKVAPGNHPGIFKSMPQHKLSSFLVANRRMCADINQAEI